MKRGDMWLFGVIAVVMSLLFIMWFQNESTAEAYEGNKYARITIDREHYQTVKITDNEQLIEVRSKRGYNLLQIKDGGIRMLEADCPDDLCKLMGFKDQIGETIVCLPNRVLVELVGDTGEEAMIDAVAN